MIERLVALLILAPAVFGGARLSAEIRVVKRPDGSTFLYNVSASRQARSAVRSEGKPDLGADLEAIVGRHADRSALEPKLVKAVIQVESAFDPRARSRKGAMGLMQLMPGTAAAYAVSDPFDPDQNVRAGTRYLRRLIDSHGELELALAAYNAGPAAVKRFQGVPPYPETRDYVEKVMRLYKGDSKYSLAGSRHLRRGRKTYVTRDASGRLMMTTTPPRG